MHEVVAKGRFEKDVRNLSPAIAARLGLVINSSAYPKLDVTVAHTKPLRIVLTAPQWDEVPPSIALCHIDGQPMKDGIPGGVFNPSAHPATGLPFVCMPGAVEFHTHGSHIREVWDGFRGTAGKTLTGIVMQLADAWRTMVR